MSISKRAVIGVGAAVTSAVGIGAAVALWAAGSATAGTSHSDNSVRHDSAPVRSDSAPIPSVPSNSAEHREPVFLRGYDSATGVVSYSTATRVNGGPDNGYWRAGTERHQVVLAPGARFYSAFANCAGGGGLTLDDQGTGSTPCPADTIHAGEIAWITVRTGGSEPRLVTAREIYHP